MVLVSGQYKWIRKLLLSINKTFGFILSFLEEHNVLFMYGGIRSREHPSLEAPLSSWGRWKKYMNQIKDAWN